MKPFFFLTSFFSIISLFSVLNAQTNNSTKNICDVNLAISLVRQQAAESRSVSESNKRIRILIRVAEFLWKIDEESARRYFTDAFDFAEDRFNELGFERRKIGASNGTDVILPNPDYRFEVIRAISKKDQEWANRLTDKVLKNYKNEAETRKNTPDETREVATILAIANDLIKTNPQLAMNLYRRAMQFPSDRHWFWQMYGVYRQDQNFADNLYLELIRNYSNAPPSRFLFLSAYPFGRGKFFGADRFQFNVGVPKNFAPQRNLQLQFLNTFFSRTERFLNDADEFNAPARDGKLAELSYIVSALKEIEPYIIRDFPNLSERFIALKIKSNALMTEENSKQLEDKEERYKDSTRSFEEKLKRLEEAEEKETITDAMIAEVIFSAETEEDFKLAESWLDKIKDGVSRSLVSDWFFYNRTELGVRENRIEDAENFSEKIKDAELKALAAFGIAHWKVNEKIPKTQAAIILLDVSKLVDKTEVSIEKAWLHLGLALDFEDINHPLALDEIRNAVAVFNKLENPEILNDFVNKSIKVQNRDFDFMIGVPGANIEKVFEKISVNDFQLPLAHAQSLNDKYLRTLSVLAIAGNCTKNDPKKTTK